ncbi:hypothetical protein MLD38_003190 [Melastoma candidum]|uniref:Uncharacterized protein n=1 Tax=Melastoma candidum TaxID=119954 RepID=A0ACB9S4Y6_9MYRT|nr:hypothetical protein MLD38_003190 [Melastoma candidum]
MVQQKHHGKSKPKKQRQPPVKKQGKQADLTQFRSQLDALGLKIVQVTADGNCFFRALADQLEGNEDEHSKYRSMVVQYIQRNREMFEPFIEDEVPFEEYCQTMDNDGTWAGHMELQAASLLTESNICIHRHMSPRWYIKNFEKFGTRMIHLSYHDEEHYNSVRSKDDSGDGPARAIVIKADSDLSSSAKSGSNKSKVLYGLPSIDSGAIKLVMAGSNCSDREKVEQTLMQTAGDVDAAIEYLLAEQSDDLLLEESVPSSSSADACNGHDMDRQSKSQDAQLVKEVSAQDPSDYGIKRSHEDSNRLKEQKAISRNKACPCGSKKKYKSCCGTVARRSSAALVNLGVETRNSRKEKKQGRGGTSDALLGSGGSDGGPPDMGALCI